MQFEFNISTIHGSLPGVLSMPNDARGVVLFIQGSGSSRHNPRNRTVSTKLTGARIATLLFDLLTPGEELIDLDTGEYRFNIALLAERVDLATYALREHVTTFDLPIGYFGIGTGAGAALVAASRHPTWIDAVVARGGRPDLADDALRMVRAPTLLIVGGDDLKYLEWNRTAFNHLSSEKMMHIIPGASHLFGEPGALDRVAELATNWFGDQFETRTSELPAEPMARL